jgi:hypothetical protein
MPGQERDQGPLSSTSRKDPSSFGRKAAIPSERDPTLPKYAEPLRQIKDLAGVVSLHISLERFLKSIRSLIVNLMW